MTHRWPLPVPPAPLVAAINRAATRVPPLAAHFLAAVPAGLERPVLERALNHALAVSLDAGEFDFLRGRTVAIHVLDAGWRMALTAGTDGRLRVLDIPGTETRISARAGDLLALAAGHVDPDTLFFQRRLRIDGDVALGLEVKNTLDRIDPASLPGPLRVLLQAARAWMARGDQASGTASPAMRTLPSPGRPYQ